MRPGGTDEWTYSEIIARQLVAQEDMDTNAAVWVGGSVLALSATDLDRLDASSMMVRLSDVDQRFREAPS